MSLTARLAVMTLLAATVLVEPSTLASTRAAGTPKEGDLHTIVPSGWLARVVPA